MDLREKNICYLNPKSIQTYQQNQLDLTLY